MSVAQLNEHKTRQLPCSAMRANVFHSPGRCGLPEAAPMGKAIPKAGVGDAVMHVRLTTVCETDVDIVNGPHPVEAGHTLGHEAVGVIHEPGVGVAGYEIGRRVPVGAAGGLRSSIDGTQAEYVLILQPQENLAIVPNALSDEQVLLLTQVASSGFAAAEQANVQFGDTVAVFVHGPLGLCALPGARLRGAAEMIAVDCNDARLAVAQQYGASVTLQPGEDLAAGIQFITDRRGVDVAFVDRSDVRGVQPGLDGESFAGALRALRPGGTLSSVGVSCGQLKAHPPSGELTSDVAREATCGTGPNEQTMVSTLCPGGEERMRRLMRQVQAHRIDLSPLVTHVFALDDIIEAYELFESHRNGMLKVGIRVS